jgi:cytochrome P450
MPSSSRVKALLARTVESCNPNKQDWPAAKRKARWEQKMMDEIAHRYPIDVAAALIGAYANKRPWAIRRFNEIDAQIKARKARI